MKKQIRRFSPHQNGKVIAILMAVGAAFMFVPMGILMALVAPPVDQHGNPVSLPFVMFAVMPLFYLVFGYLFVAISCAVYNFFYRFIGGIEFETDEGEVSRERAGAE